MLHEPFSIQLFIFRRHISLRTHSSAGSFSSELCRLHNLHSTRTELSLGCIFSLLSLPSARIFWASTVQLYVSKRKQNYIQSCCFFTRLCQINLNLQTKENGSLLTKQRHILFKKNVIHISPSNYLVTEYWSCCVCI